MMHNLLVEVPHMGGEKENLELSVNIQTVTFHKVATTLFRI